MRTREEIRALAQDSYADYMMGDPFSDDAQPSPTSFLSTEEQSVYHEVVQELADERAAKRN